MSLWNQVVTKIMPNCYESTFPSKMNSFALCNTKSQRLQNVLAEKLWYNQGRFVFEKTEFCQCLMESNEWLSKGFIFVQTGNASLPNQNDQMSQHHMIYYQKSRTIVMLLVARQNFVVVIPTDENIFSVTLSCTLLLTINFVVCSFCCTKKYNFLWSSFVAHSTTKF